MDSSVDHQLDAIRLATQALLQTQGQGPTMSLVIDGEIEIYQTSQTMLILPKGLKVLGSGENLKIEYQTGLHYSEAPVFTLEQQESLKELKEYSFTAFFTLLAVVFIGAFLFDLLFKKLLK